MKSGIAPRAMGTSFLLAAAAFAASLAPAGAVTFNDLHVFCSQAGCPDGAYPTAPLVMDSAGDLFGTTALGGAASWGTIFEFLPDGKGGYKFKSLHSFCAQTNCTDGKDPVAGLIIDTSGNLYGTTKFGGAQNGGIAFELVLSGGKKKYRVLHSFCAQGASCADGSLPVYDGLAYRGGATGAPYDGTSPLYGTTIYGGENNAGYSGTVYELKPRGGRKWKETVVYQFCTQTNCADGSEPQNGLVVDAQGNLFGVTYGGGGNGDGTVFELSHRNGAWSETVLYDFCSMANCADGANPESPLALDTAGDFIGTTTSGGAHGNGGILYSIAPNGGNSTFAVLYNFCAQANCADGSNPTGRLALDSFGDIFGTALAGGGADFGTAWELSAGTFAVLHSFCSSGNCGDGQWPVGGVTLDSAGDIFGTASEGGSYNQGVVFELTP